MAVVTVTLVLPGLIARGTEQALHRLLFFVSRNAGAAAG